jgi:hypothetical protein
LSFKQHTIGLNLDLLNAKLKTKQLDDKTYVLDPIRKSWIVLQPEEWVRQLIIIYLNEIVGFPLSLIQVEKKLILNGQTRRFDIIVYDREIKPYILVECKAPNISVHQSAFDQVAAYNYAVNAPYLLVTNGLNNYCAQMDFDEKRFSFLNAIPALI